MIKTMLRRIFIVLLPFGIMTLFNEWQRPNESKDVYQYFDVNTMNSGARDPEKCSWACHNRTVYCKEHHVRYLNDYLKYTDVPYFTMISGLKSTGNYRMANIVLLVIIIPGLIMFFFIRTLELREKIHQITSNKAQA
jgi:hypothetical protein